MTLKRRRLEKRRSRDITTHNMLVDEATNLKISNAQSMSESELIQAIALHKIRNGG